MPWPKLQKARVRALGFRPPRLALDAELEWVLRRALGPLGWTPTVHLSGQKLIDISLRLDVASRIASRQPRALLEQETGPGPAHRLREQYVGTVARGGPVIRQIELVPVYFGNGPLRADLERFNSWIVGSNYWKQAGAEYGVRAGTRLPAIEFDSIAAGSVSDTQIAGWLDARIADGSLPKPSVNILFAPFYPAGVTITSGTGTSCIAFGALHEAVSVSNPIFTGDVPFAIIPRCSYSPGDELMVATDVSSHEYMEAATCPLPLSDATWFMENNGGPLEAWQSLSGPAVADLCLNQSYDVIDGFAVNDIWSNVAAQAGNNPCQPSDPTRPFFSVSAEETIYHAQPGTTLTIRARAWSNLPAPDWSLAVNWGLEPSSDFNGQAALNKTTVNNGDEVTATVTVPANPPVVDGRSVYRFTIDSIDPINPNFSHPWPFLVIVP